MGKLNVAKIKSLSTPGLHGDGDTLYLNVSKGGTKSWVQRLTIQGKRTDLGLGPWPLVSLKQARERAFLNRKAVYDGGDPLEAKREAKRRAQVPSFEEAAREAHAINTKGMSDKGRKLWLSMLERHAFPIVGRKPVNRVTTDDLLHILRPIWHEKAESARKTRQRLKQVLAWAEGKGYVDRNVAGASFSDVVRNTLGAQRDEAENMRMVPYPEVGASLETIAASSSLPSAKAALRFLVLTACRSGEVRNATWDEIDLAAATWTVPAARTKTRKDHAVPLSAAAIAVLDEMERHPGGGDLVFPGNRRGKALSDMTLSKLMKTCAIDGVPHGYRASFKTWATERTNEKPDVIELCLGHAVGNSVERAYSRSTLIEKRRAVMERWADFVTGEAGKVVQLRA